MRTIRQELRVPSRQLAAPAGRERRKARNGEGRSVRPVDPGSGGPEPGSPSGAEHGGRDLQPNIPVSSRRRQAGAVPDPDLCMTVTVAGACLPVFRSARPMLLAVRHRTLMARLPAGGASATACQAEQSVRQESPRRDAPLATKPSAMDIRIAIPFRIWSQPSGRRHGRRYLLMGERRCPGRAIGIPKPIFRSLSLGHRNVACVSGGLRQALYPLE